MAIERFRLPLAGDLARQRLSLLIEEVNEADPCPLSWRLG
jgi:hypothetical protein